MAIDRDGIDEKVLDQKLKDQLRKIELGEDELFELYDPEEYDEQGGIKSLDRGAPSIRIAGDSAEEEFSLELLTLLDEYKAAIKDGTFKGSFSDYADRYFGVKKMAYGGRMQLAEGMPKKYNFEELIDKDAEDLKYKATEEKLDRRYNPQNYPPSQRNMTVEQLKEMLRKQEARRRRGTEEDKKEKKSGIAGVL